MFEYSSVSASSYDPGALVAKLNESTADGWDVVAIVPTGGDVSAFLKREVPADVDAAGATETAEPTDGTPSDEAVGAAAAVGAVDVVPDVTPEDTTPEEGEAAVDATGETEAPAEAPSAVEEPAGWAAAPEETPTEVPLGTSGDSAVEPAAVAAAVAAEPAAAAEEPAPAAEATPTAEPTPAPAPAAPEPAPVVTTPAGWYPDPSGRYELRYWDGTQWTEHVARQGQQFTDPPVR